MTIFCSHCQRPLPAQRGCLPHGAGHGPAAAKPFRSTKDASKARRDQINAELQALRALLPVSCREKERLSYLNTLALVCLRLRAARLFPAEPPPPVAPALGTDLLSLLPGFLLVLLADGKVAYVSENVREVLGLSTAELLSHGDTVFDMVEGTAREVVREKLLLAQEQPGAAVTFVSEMRTCKALRLRHGGARAVAVRGRFAAPPAAFVALCTPVGPGATAAAPDELFHSVHGLDMAFADVTHSVIYHLGYRREELLGRSWYSLLHPEDTQLAAAQHRAVALGPGAAPSAAAVLRLLRADRTWLWLHAALRRDRGSISCTGRSLREDEAAHLRARQRLPPPAAAPPCALGLLAAQLRALADSLEPPPGAGAGAVTGAWPGAAPPAPHHDGALARLLGDALGEAGPPAAHAHGALYAHAHGALYALQ